MKKGLFAVLIAMCALSGCTKGIEKEYTMEIKEAPIVAHLKDNETQAITVVHCKRGMSLLNYYIAIPDLEEGFVIPDKLTAKETDNKTKYIIINEKNKSDTVSDHGYVFVKWGEK